MNNENECEVDVPEENLNAGLPIVVPKGTTPMNAPSTPQEMRVIEVNEALAPAYAKASTLELTDLEIEALMANFPDDMVEVRPHDGLIYIPHIHISDRLNGVLKPGKWSLICRRHWLEGTTMYGEYILVIRGCYVGESVGGHPYIANNPKNNYSDALEATAAEALRRICGKRLSCGSQVWDPTYANMWCEKYRGHQNGKYFKIMLNEPKPKKNGKKNGKEKEPSKAEMAEKAKKFATMLAGVKEMATQFCVDLGWIMPNEGLADVSYTHLPKTQGQFRQFKEALEKWAKDGAITNPYLPHHETVTNVPHGTNGNVPFDDPDNDDAEWRTFPMPYGKNAGVPLEDLDKKYLFGLWANYEVETQFTNKDGNVIKLKPEKIEANRKFRAMLDQAGQHYEFTKKD